MAPKMSEDMDVDSQSPNSGDMLDDTPQEDAFEAFDEMDEASEDSERSLEKDDTEEELEKLVFGDTAGFKQEIKTWRATGEDLVAQDEDALDTVNDSDLFFVDSGPDPSLAANSIDRSDGTLQQRAPPAWEDSDDDRMMVSLMSVPRMRKLRRYDGEDVITGREYQRRLRQQFELLNPRPKWAQTATAVKSKKRRRGSSAGDESDEGSEDGDFTTQPLAKLLRSNISLTRTTPQMSNKRPKLRPEVLAMERMKDILPTQSSVITSISIHPTMPLLLSTGPSSTLYLHHLRPHPTPPDPANPLIISLHLKHTALTTTAFSPSTPDSLSFMPKIYLSSRRRYFHTWDLTSGAIAKVTRIHGHSSTQKTTETLKPSPCDRYIALLGSSKKNGGVVNILDANTTFWIAQASLESSKGVADFAWWADGTGMSIVGRGGEVAEYSMDERKIIGRWQDEGAVGITTTVLSGAGAISDHAKTKKKDVHIGPDRYIAIGSTSGIVNIYERSTFNTTITISTGTCHPKPLKSLDHLTTPISNMAFSPCGQLLVISSRWKRDALRLVHLPSATVYRNWPTSKTPLGRVSALALGEYEGGEGMRRRVLIVGNETGVLRGWEVGV